LHDKVFAGNIDFLRSPERVKRLDVQHVVDMCLKEASIKSMLDIGTGSGLFAEAFAKRGLKVAGIDTNPTMVAAAKRFVPQGDFQIGTAEMLLYPDKSFDLVFLGLVLHESDNAAIAIREALRVSCKIVCVLEWPYRNQLFGPPLAHRLKPERFAELFQEAGVMDWQMTEFTHTILYRIEV
jgi:ubiquinone/menaquinone biosynthesis C-methylase UbiE